MPYELRVDYPLSFFSDEDEIPTTEQARIIKALKDETDFSKQLTYYNKHARSLALEASWATLTYPHAAHPDEVEIYHDCSEAKGICQRCCTPKQREIYLQHRAAEVERVVSELTILSSYEAKLRYFFGLPGNYIDRMQRGIWSNWPGVTDTAERKKRLSHNDDRDDLPIIDLSPNTPEETEVFNRLVESSFTAKYKTSEGGFTRYWKGFDFELEKARLNTTLAKALDPKVIVEELLVQVEEHFGYRRPHKEIEFQLGQGQGKTIIALNETGESYFLAMVGGTDNGIDFSSKMLLLHDFESYEHAHQVYLFYAYLRRLQDGTTTRIESEQLSNTGTTPQQVLALHYLLEYAKAPVVDLTRKAEFIQFLTGKNEKNIYDAVRSPLATKSGKLRREDLQTIRLYFENLGLVEIVKAINNELAKPER